MLQRHSPESAGGIDRAAEDFHALGERAAKRGIRVGFRGARLGAATSTYLAATRSPLAGRDMLSVGLVLDTFHILSRKTDLNALTPAPQHRIFPGPTGRRAAFWKWIFWSWSRHFLQFSWARRFSRPRVHDGFTADRL